MTDHASRSSAKRRKIRKGTFSCWECKNRKIRCKLEPRSKIECQFCQRRGLACISQEFPDPAESGFGGLEATDLQQDGLEQRSLERTWSFPGEDVGVVGDHSASLSYWLDVPANVRRPHLPLELIPDLLSSRLHSILPDAKTATLIMNRGKFFSLPIHIRRHSLQKVISSIQSVEAVAQVSTLPTPSAHPLHFARKLIQLALCLQQMDATATERLEIQLKESVHDIARRYVEIASCYVTSQDSLVQSQDGLGTFMLEACYHINIGNLRSAWLLFRRALSIAQLLGLPRPSARIGDSAESVWFHLIYADRFMSLMLGLPCAISEDNFTTEIPSAEHSEFEKLERIHVIVLGRIIARNLRMQRHQRKGNNDACHEDYKVTQDIDYSMKQATKAFPVAWWTSPTLEDGVADEEIMNKTANLLGQMHHYSYLAILHLPYVIYNSLSQSITNSGSTGDPKCDYSYSNTAALSASREALSRFLVLRKFHQVLSYRSLDDKAYLNAILVILSHINGHRLGRGNVLEHQRPQDLTLLHDVILCMEVAARRNIDALSRTNIQNLKKIMAIEAECAEGIGFDMWLEENPEENQSHDLNKQKVELRMKVPYFGTLYIARQELIDSQPTQSSLEVFEPDISTFLISGTNGLCDLQNDFQFSSLSSETLDSCSLFFPAQDHGSQASTLFDLQPASNTPSTSARHSSSADELFMEDEWQIEDGDVAFQNEWVVGQTHTSEAPDSPRDNVFKTIIS
jgi:hypothetical protein